MWEFINANKTKVLGIATVVLGFIQAYPGLRDMLSDTGYAWTMFTIGIGVTICGFLNSKAKPDGGVPALFIAVLITFVLGTGLGGCSGTLAAYKEANDPAEYAYVLSEHYASLLNEAATLKERDAIPPNVVRTLQQADNAAKPVILQLRNLRGAFMDSANATTEAQLQEGIDRAVRVIADMIRAVNTARGARTGMTERISPLENLDNEYAQVIFNAPSRANRFACVGVGAVCVGQGARSGSETL